MSMSANSKNYMEKLINKVGHLYDFSESIYVNNRTPIIVICKKCGNSALRIPWNVIKSKSCKKCNSINQSNNLADFIEKAKEIHGNKYCYDKSCYINAKHKISIKCNTCSLIFDQLPRAHIYGKQGCPYCKESHGESKIKNILDFMEIEYIREKKFIDCIGSGGRFLKFDFYLPTFNLCIEYDGRQHYDNTSKFWSKELVINDEIKNNYCKKHDIILKRIRETHFDSIREIISSTLALAPNQ